MITFNKTTIKSSKYLKVSLLLILDEVPIVLHELNEAAIKYLAREMPEKALILLQKANGIINVVSLQSTSLDSMLGFYIYHNMAACYQKMSTLEECALSLHQCLLFMGDYSSLSD